MVMLQQAGRVATDLLRYDPGAIRLVRGVDLMLTILAAVALAALLGRFVTSVPAFTLAVVTAFPAAFCILFTPVSTRRQEMADILRLGLIITSVSAAGALAVSLSGSSAPIVLQVLWVVAIAFGFALDGLGGFWQRGGRVVAMSWLLVILFSQSHAPGLWLPAMAVVGTAVAICIRIVLWRPSPERTYQRIEKVFRRAVAEQLEAITLVSETSTPADGGTSAELAALRTELRLSGGLLDRKTAIRGLPPESAVMLQLALEVVRDAVSQLSPDGGIWLSRDSGFRKTVLLLRDRIAYGPGSASPGEDWMRNVDALSRDDRFQVLRIAQAFRRLSLLSSKSAPLASHAPGNADATAEKVWKKLSWRLALQAAVAASVGYSVAAYFDLNHAYWVTLTIIIILANSLGVTIRKTVQRTVGTAAGVLIALAVDPLLSGYPDIRLTLVVLSIPAILVFVERNYAIAVGFISFMVMVGLQTLEHFPLIEFWARLYDTMIGAAVGLSAAWLLFPVRTGQSVHDLSTSYLASCVQFLTASIRSEEEERNAYARLNDTASRLVSTAGSYRTEQAPWSSFSNASNGLDVMVVVLADYLVLYREARATVLGEAGERQPDPAVVPIVTRMDNRLQAEFEAVLEGREKQTDPALVDDWMAAMPETASAGAGAGAGTGTGTGTGIMVDWVAMLYYARKVVQCLDGLRQDGMWNGAVINALR